MGKTIVERIDILLCKNNLRRKALADYAGISIQAFTNWSTRGNCPSADVAIKMANYLGVTVEYLITGAGPAKPDVSDAIRHIETALDGLKKLLKSD
jgi:transcriptional regulator with XRE-family HTH domain